MYITINGNLYELTWDNLQEIHRQQMIELAQNIIEMHDDGFLNDDAKKLTDDELFEIGEKFDEWNSRETGNLEWNLLEHFGLTENENN